MLVDAAKEVCASMNVQHDAVAALFVLLSQVVIGSHLDPLGLEIRLGLAPLPPLSAADLANAALAQLLSYQLGGAGEMFRCYLDGLNLDPLGMGNPLCGECLELFNGVMRGKFEERPNQVQTFVVRQVGRRPLFERLSIEILLRRKHCQLSIQAMRIHQFDSGAIIFTGNLGSEQWTEASGWSHT